MQVDVIKTAHYNSSETIAVIKRFTVQGLVFVKYKVGHYFGEKCKNCLYTIQILDSDESGCDIGLIMLTF
jgi:hypothetical protein